MPKKSDYPEAINLRLTTQQRVFVENVAELHGLTTSDIIRGFIDSARADDANATLEAVNAQFK